MPYSVVLLFEEPTIHSINAVKDSLALGQTKKQGESSIEPHLTLAIFDDIDCAACENKLANLANSFQLDTINFDHFGLFTQNSNTLFLAARITLGLLKFHHEAHQILSESTKGSWEMYQPGKWVPHITLAKSIPTDSLGEALDLSRAINLPFTAQIARIGVVFFDPTQTIYQVKVK